MNKQVIIDQLKKYKVKTLIDQFMEARGEATQLANIASKAQEDAKLAITRRVAAEAKLIAHFKVDTSVYMEEYVALADGQLLQIKDSGVYVTKITKTV